jgi:hypothetical protein
LLPAEITAGADFCFHFYDVSGRAPPQARSAGFCFSWRHRPREVCSFCQQQPLPLETQSRQIFAAFSFVRTADRERRLLLCAELDTVNKSTRNVFWVYFIAP